MGANQGEISGGIWGKFLGKEKGKVERNLEGISREVLGEWTGRNLGFLG